MRTVLLILAIALFLVGPIAKINNFNIPFGNGNLYMIASALGLVMITAMAFIKKK